MLFQNHELYKSQQLTIKNILKLSDFWNLEYVPQIKTE